MGQLHPSWLIIGLKSGVRKIGVEPVEPWTVDILEMNLYRLSIVHHTDGIADEDRDDAAGEVFGVGALGALVSANCYRLRNTNTSVLPGVIGTTNVPTSSN